MQKHAGTIIGVGIAAVLVVVAVIGFLATQRDGVSVSDFEIEVYQGEEILGGRHVRFADVLARSEPVVLNFWAGNCPPCRFEMPDLQRSYESHGGQVLFLGLDVGVFTGLGSRQSALVLLDELGITYPAGAPSDRGALVNYRVTAMPTTVFFDADGQVFRRWEGIISESQLNGVLAEMLQ